MCMAKAVHLAYPQLSWRSFLLSICDSMQFLGASKHRYLTKKCTFARGWHFPWLYTGVEQNDITEIHLNSLFSCFHSIHFLCCHYNIYIYVMSIICASLTSWGQFFFFAWSCVEGELTCWNNLVPAWCATSFDLNGWSPTPESLYSNMLPKFHGVTHVHWNQMDSIDVSTCIWGAKVFSFGWWMGMYGSATPKRHRGFSNNPGTSFLDLGSWKRAFQKQKKVKTVRKYINKDGKLSYCGTKALKDTQSLPQLFYIYLGPWKKLIFQNCINLCFSPFAPVPNFPRRCQGLPEGLRWSNFWQVWQPCHRWLQQASSGTTVWSREWGESIWECLLHYLGWSRTA